MSDPIIIEPDAWCEWCGNPLPEREERKWNQRFCCAACGEANRLDLMRVARLDLREDRNCRHCETAFKAKGPAHWFCSISCQGKARYRRKTGRAETAGTNCEYCGTGIALGQHYCSATCKVLAFRGRQAAKKRKGKDAPCG